MLIDLNEVLKCDGKVAESAVMPQMEQFVSRMGTFPITDKTPVSLKIRNRGNKELQITGEIALTVCIPCSRCLEDVPVKFQLPLERVVDMKLTQEDRVRALDEQAYMDGYNLDVDKLVYSELLENWPSKVLCKEDCKGICSQCGTNLNHHTCNCRREDTDPRMAKIQEIFNKFKEV